MSKVSWSDFPRELPEKGTAENKPLIAKSQPGKNYHPRVVWNHISFLFVSLKFEKTPSVSPLKKLLFFQFTLPSKVLGAGIFQ